MHAQWNDDFHHALHAALTGKSQGYYADFARDPLAALAKTLTRGTSTTAPTPASGAARTAVRWTAAGSPRTG
ncbi:hypothetical protein STENM327S_05534 [Streptomyces tendae]